jgi:hypothetical protein
MKNRRTRLLVIIETGVILVAVVCFLRHSVSSSLKSALRAPVSVPHVLSAKAVANITVKTPCATPVAVSEPEAPSFGWAEGVVALVSKALTPDERNEANRILTDLSEETPDDELFGSLVFRLAQNNPLSASKLASTLPAGEARQRAFRIVGIAWSAISLSEAAEWALNLTDSADRQSAVAAVSGEMLRTDPQLALCMALALPFGQDRTQLIHRGISEWGCSDPASAFYWGTKIPDSALREQAIGLASVAWAESDPARAAAALVLRVGDGRESWSGRECAAAAVGIVQRWAQKDPLAAGEWIMNYLEGRMAEDATQYLVSVWAGKDLGSLAGWLEKMPEGSLHDIGLESLSRALAPSNLLLAQQIAGLISGEPRRVACLASLCQN